MPYPHSLSKRSLIMPNVYVIPPEEDLEEPWCFFDAQYPDGYPSDSESDFNVQVDIVHGTLLHHDTPTFHRDIGADLVVMPRRSLDTPTPPVAISDDDLELADDYDNTGDITIRANEPGDCSEVIEVVKVRRVPEKGFQDAQAPKSSMKRSQTFLSKASRAFRSIKNVNRSSSKPHVDEVFCPSESTKSKTSTVRSTASSFVSVADTAHTPKKRRGSFVLSQIFTSPPPKSRDSVETFTSRPTSILSRPSSSSLSTSYSELPTIPNEDSQKALGLERSASPTPSTRTFSNKRRFSVLNLFAKANESVPMDSSPPSLSRDSLGPSSISTCSSSSGPSTPVSSYTDFPPPPPIPPKTTSVPLLKRIPSFMRKDHYDARRPASAAIVVDEPFDAGGDISFEMRLNSLHFDDLSFDADQFR